MKIKHLELVLFVTCITVVGASAASYWNSGSGGMWSEAAKWNGGVPADNGVSTYVRAADMGGVSAADYSGPSIQAGDNFVARNLAIEVGTANSITLTMTGGALSMTRSGGTSNYLRLGAGGSTGTAILNMSGGVITIDSNDDVYSPGVNNLVRVGSGYTGKLNMSGTAQIKARDLSIGSDTGSSVDLSDSASIILKGDETLFIMSVLPDGRLTSNSGTVANVAYTYNAGTDETTLTATTVPPDDIQTPYSLVTSGFTQWDSDFDLVASAYWSPIGYAFTGTVWQISTSSNDFSSAVWTGIAGGVESITVPGNTLLEGNSYYARVQYQSDGGDVWSAAHGLSLIQVETIAYWRFEQGTAGVQHTGERDDWYEDLSGHTNHLSALSAGQNLTPIADVPVDYIAGLGPTPNTTAMSAYDVGLSVVGTFGTNDLDVKMIRNYTFTQGWTIECSFKVSPSALGGDNMVCFGKDGYVQAGVNEQPFAFKFLNDSDGDSLRQLRCLWWWDASARNSITTADVIQLGKWYSVAATYDAGLDEVSFYMKGEGEENYTLIGTKQGTGVGCDLSPTLIEPLENNWVIGLGRRQGVVNYFYRGLIDEVRISKGVLTPGQFIRSRDPIPEIGNIVLESLNAGSSLTWTTGADYSYTLLESPSLTIPNWTTNAAGIVGGIDQVTVVIPADSPAAFYKVSSEN